MENIAICVHVCLSLYVCLSTHIISKTTSPNFTKFLNVLSVAGSILLWRQCTIMYFRFCGWRHVCLSARPTGRTYGQGRTQWGHKGICTPKIVMYMYCTSKWHDSKCDNELKYYTLCLKNVTSLSCYNSDIHKSILIVFCVNVTEKVGNQIVAPHLTSVSALHGEIKKDKNSTLSLKCSTVVLPNFNQSLGKIYSVLLLITYACAAIWLSKSHS